MVAPLGLKGRDRSSRVAERVAGARLDDARVRYDSRVQTE